MMYVLTDEEYGHMRQQQIHKDQCKKKKKKIKALVAGYNASEMDVAAKKEQILKHRFFLKKKKKSTGDLNKPTESEQNVVLINIYITQLV